MICHRVAVRQLGSVVRFLVGVLLCFAQAVVMSTRQRSSVCHVTLSASLEFDVPSYRTEWLSYGVRSRK